MLTAYYDLDKCPPTYDIVAPLSVFELERRKRGEDGGRIIFVPGTRNGFRNDKFWPFTTEGRQHMLDHVAIPMARMLPGFTVEMGERHPAHAERRSIGYGHPMYGLAVQVAAMREGIRPLRPSDEYAQNPRLITITLRECEHWPERNSNVDAWMDAALTINKKCWFEIIFIRDALQAEMKCGPFETSPVASVNLQERAKLYRAAFCNLFVNNGPAWFAMALDAPVLMLKPTVENLMRSCSAEYFRECGIEPGGQIPNSPAYQRIVWAEDTAENIVNAFEEFTGAASAAA